MELQSSPLYPEVQRILKSKTKQLVWDYYAVFQVLGNKDGETTVAKQYKALKVVSLDMVGDYANNYADEIMLEVSFGAGTFANEIYPNLNNICVVLMRYALNELGTVNDSSKPLEAFTYRCTLLDQGSPELQQQTQQPLSTFDLDISNLVTARFQLFDKTLEILRTVSVGGNFRDTNVGDTLVGLLTEGSTKVDLKGSPAVTGVDMVPAANTTVYQQLVVPQGTNLIDLPNHMHGKYGIYSSGVGFYFYRLKWYVWPLMDLTRFSESERMTTFIIIPPKAMTGLERTYLLEGNALSVVATGDAESRESNEATQLNKGTGIRFADANKIMDGAVEVKDNKITIQRAKTATEVNAVKRPNGVNYSPFSNERIQSNPYVEYSRLSTRDGSIIGLTWETSDPTLIYPGMSARIMYQGKDEVVTLEGVLQKAHTYYHLNGVGVTTARYRSSTAMYFYVKRNQPGDTDGGTQ